MIGSVGTIFIFLFFITHCTDNADESLLLNVVDKMRSDLLKHPLDKLPTTQKNKNYEVKVYNHFDVKLHLRIEEAYRFAYGLVDLSLEFKNIDKQGVRCNHTGIMLAFLSYNMMLCEIPVSRRSKRRLLSLFKVYKKHLSDSYELLDPYVGFQRNALSIRDSKKMENKEKLFDQYMQRRKITHALRENLAQYKTEMDKVSVLVQNKKPFERGRRKHKKSNEEKVDRAPVLIQVKKAKKAGHTKHKEPRKKTKSKKLTNKYTKRICVTS
ncbi:MAG: hypothetical protein WD055_03520 [Candidatus Dependentiae bacterium]